MFLRKGEPDCRVHLCLGVSAELWALECVVLGICSGNWAKQRKEFLLATGLLPLGSQTPVGLLGMGRTLMNVSVVLEEAIVTQGVGSP